MWWRDQIAVWQQLWPARDVALLALIMAADAITGLSIFLTMRRRTLNQRDLALLIFLVICSTIFSIWGDFLPTRHVLVDAIPFNGREEVFFESRTRQSAYWLSYLIILLELQIVCAAACGILGRLRGRSYYIWMALGYFGNVGALLWLLLRTQTREAVAGLSER